MFNAFSPLNGGNLATYGYPTESPFDLDAGLDYVRPKTGDTLFPFPVVTGWIDGYTPLFNKLEYSLMLGKVPAGPWTGEQMTPNNIVFPNIMGSIAKVSG